VSRISTLEVGEEYTFIENEEMKSSTSGKPLAAGDFMQKVISTGEMARMFLIKSVHHFEGRVVEGNMMDGDTTKPPSWSYVTQFVGWLEYTMYTAKDEKDKHCRIINKSGNVVFDFLKDVENKDGT